MRQLYFDQGLRFLQNFPGYNDIKILGTETKFEYPVDDWIFNGIMDLAFEDKDGRLVIDDYKSKSGFASKKEQAEYARQLYLYAPYIKQKYGRYPDILRFTMFRKEQIIDIPFTLDGLNEAISWAKDTVREIRECWDFYPSCDAYFGQNICSHRLTCGSKTA